MTEASEVFVELSGVSKRFGATRALRRVDLRLHAAEIHVVAGENGAGKSTLIRVLSGVYQPDAGTLRIAGVPRLLASPAQAFAAGVSTIHQELSLVGSMTVADNLHLGLPGPAWQWLRPQQRQKRARGWLERVGLPALDPATPLEQLPLASRQLVEIARALRRDLRLLILDEPTSALEPADRERLLSQLERLRADGCALLYVSHRPDELERLADRVTVLRDGEVAHQGPAGEVTAARLMQLMAGRSLARPARPARSTEAAIAEPARGKLLLDVRGARLQEGPLRRLRGVSLSVAAGEIVGLAGPADGGGALLLRALMGVLPAHFEHLQLAGRPLRKPSPRLAIAAGMHLLSGDRALGLLDAMSVLDNAALSALPAWSKWGFVRRGPLRLSVERLAAAVSLKAPDLDSPCASLSGGNQQKVALMRSLMCAPRVLLLDDATRGIDVAAKAQIHEQIQQYAASGMAVVAVSSDTAELVRMCSRVLVMVAGSIRCELRGAELTRQAVVAAASAREAP